MPLESGTVLDDLNALWPLGGDPKSQGDDHIRLIKAIVQNDAASLDRIANGNEPVLDDRYARQQEVGPVDIVEADTSQGWQVWGDTLIQWGDCTQTQRPMPVTFAQPFKAGTLPSVSVITGPSNTHNVATVVTVLSETGFTYSGTEITPSFGPTQNGMRAEFIAIGEAPDALKKPKTVQTIGGTELQEFHDPAGVASWRIVGNTLEVWGRKVGNDKTPTVFPKTFARQPRLTLSVDNVTEQPDTSAYSAVAWGVTESQFQSKAFFILLTAINVSDAPIDWHAIGEWDGVS